MHSEPLIGRQPIESQRLQLWASRFGKTEVFMDELGKRHFENAASASARPTLLAAAAAAGLNPAKFLNP